MPRITKAPGLAARAWKELRGPLEATVGGFGGGLGWYSATRLAKKISKARQLKQQKQKIQGTKRG